MHGCTLTSPLCEGSFQGNSLKNRINFSYRIIIILKNSLYCISPPIYSSFISLQVGSWWALSLLSDIIFHSKAHRAGKDVRNWYFCMGDWAGVGLLLWPVMSVFQGTDHQPECESVWERLKSNWKPMKCHFFSLLCRPPTHLWVEPNKMLSWRQARAAESRTQGGDGFNPPHPMPM
jgi:hypothetical protein